LLNDERLDFYVGLGIKLIVDDVDRLFKIVEERVDDRQLRDRLVAAVIFFGARLGHWFYFI
jgi:hypothetical protein